MRCYTRHMRILRRQLIDLMEEARRQQGLELLPARLQAAMLHDAMALLPHPDRSEAKKRVTLTWRTITHGPLHRHLIIIRCPDQAFYLDAVKGYLHRADIQPIAQQTMVAAMVCDDASCDIQLRHPDQYAEENFMFIALHLSATLVTDIKETIRHIQAVLKAVDISVTDFTAMHRKLTAIALEIGQSNSETASLLDWILEERYIFFGLTCDNTRLGIMRDYRVMHQVAAGLREQIEAQPLPEMPCIEWLHLCASQHYLYSASRVEVMRICWREDQGLKHATLIGHFSRSAHHANASQTPLFQAHWETLKQTGLLRRSAFYRREIRTLYDHMPKPILLSIPPEAWLEPLKQIVDITSPTQALSTCLAPEHGDLNYLLIAMSAKRFGPNVLRNIEQGIASHEITIHGHESFGIGPYRIVLVAIHKKADMDMDAVASTISECVIFWKDKARNLLLQHASEINLPEAMRELERLPLIYQELFPPKQFLKDIQTRKQVLHHCRSMVRVHIHGHEVDIQVISCRTLALGELVDVIQAFDLKAMQESVIDFGNNDRPVRISSLRCHAPVALRQEDEARLQRALEQVFNSESSHDRINALLIHTGLDIDQIAILITLRNHLIQLLPDAAPLPLSGAMKRHPAVSEQMIRLFAAKHQPATPDACLEQSRKDFEAAMTDVQNLTDDRWFRAMAELIESSLRTNAFVRQTGEPVAIKIAPQMLGFIDHPKPYREIYVHDVHVEGIHLRDGPIARGGIRFSDRHADFRTEVLDLMATQVVKNGQIVPTGAKGGFVVRGGSDPDFVLKQYRTFIRALLGLTDNLIHRQAVPPHGIRIPQNDMEDPYLVVAADKGTARFSDDANEEARLAGFWLDDAFASGGKHGYDHKQVGITARGAWVCATHHFSRLGVDADRDAITAVGIGDMGGDVFGNGMLLNPNLQLIGAFNHRHIFLDPTPDAAKAFPERQRLFKAGGGWDQYNTHLISEGGGIFNRSAKSIPIHPNLRRILQIEQAQLSGEALIQALLSAPVDLLYNGGIGTYVKASSESHGEVQDPANNAVRINACDLRARVVCEGGNLGFTQRARIEYALNGGLINTDAIDNSAGVDMSDHEVNLKILLTVSRHKPLTIAARNSTLKKMTDTVTEQCLTNNLLQSRAVTLAAMDAEAHRPRLQRLRDTLLADKRLDLKADPGMDDDTLLPLRPLLSVLLGHEKNRIHEALDRETFSAGNGFAERLLFNYFPHTVKRRFADMALRHPLAAGIIHTEATNHLINHFGLTCVHHLQTLLPHPVGHIVQSLLLSEMILDTAPLRDAIWQLELDAETILRLQLDLQGHTLHFTEELARLCPVEQLDMTWAVEQRRNMRRFRHSTDAQGIAGQESSQYLEMLKQASQNGLTQELAAHLASMPLLAQMATAIHLASSLACSPRRAIRALQACMHLLPFEQLEASLRTSGWGAKEAHALRREWLHKLTDLKKRAATSLLEHAEHAMLEKAEQHWSSHRHWNDLQKLHGFDALQEEKPADPGHLHLILALTRLETLIDES